MFYNVPAFLVLFNILSYSDTLYIQWTTCVAASLTKSWQQHIHASHTCASINYLYTNTYHFLAHDTHDTRDETHTNNRVSNVSKQKCAEEQVTVFTYFQMSFQTVGKSKSPITFVANVWIFWQLCFFMQV